MVASRTPSPASWAPVPVIHLPASTQGVPPVAELVSSLAGPGLPLEALYLGGPSDPHVVTLCPFEWLAPPQNPLLSLTCSSGACGCPARGDGQHVQGPELGARLSWPRLKHQPQACGSSFPTRQELKHTLASRWQMTGTSFLMTNSSSSCCWHPLLHVPPVSALAGPQTTWHVLLLSVWQAAGRRREGTEGLQPGQVPTGRESASLHRDQLAALCGDVKAYR